MEEISIEGYKAFQNGLINQYGLEFEIGKPVHTEGEVKTGIYGNGFHMCLNFEDTFRFVDSTQKIILCEVIGFGKISDEFCDDYNGYYDIYACSDMVIERIVPREEIIEMAKGLSKDRLARFVRDFKLLEDEIAEIQDSLSEYDSNIQKTIAFYQFGDKNAFR